MSKEIKRDRQRPLSAQPLAGFTQRRKEQAESAKNFY